MTNVDHIELESKPGLVVGRCYDKDGTCLLSIGHYVSRNRTLDLNETDFAGRSIRDMYLEGMWEQATPIQQGLVRRPS